MIKFYLITEHNRFVIIFEHLTKQRNNLKRLKYTNKFDLRLCHFYEGLAVILFTQYFASDLKNKYFQI